ncbi:MAG: hypothetical protein EXR99_01350 [Gemmataceae bacterium]|nr:hypothetical protein [Gemmataceae bacterium]
MTRVGLDIGGANLKIAFSPDAIGLVPFELWKYPSRLRSQLKTLVPKNTQSLLVTMTGELCDCFSSKAAGVTHILNSLPKIQGKTLIWSIRGEWMEMKTALRNPLNAAASNWLALATFVGNISPKGFALAIDIGSTTTDITPLVNGVPAPHGLTDPQRLASGELVYTGIYRTPLCAYSSKEFATEFFATMGDAHLILGHLEEAEGNCSTADGRPFTLKNSFSRVARMKCADHSQWSKEGIKDFCKTVVNRQLEWIVAGIDKVVSRLGQKPKRIYLSGSGEKLARLALKKSPAASKAKIFSLAKEFSQDISHAACAYALLQIAREV